MSTLVENVAKVKSAHDALSASIEAKGVSVPAGTKLTGMPALVDQIQTGGGGGSEPTNDRVTFSGDSSTSLIVPSTVVVNMEEATDLDGCFSGCEKLTSLELSDGFGKNTTSAKRFFSDCLALTSLTLPAGFGQNATNTEYCFYRCLALTSLTLPAGFGQNATYIGNCFYQCSKLTQLTLPSGFGQNATNIGGCFSFCHALTSLHLPDGFGRNANELGNLFYNCENLTTITGNPNFKASLDLSTCSNLTHDSLMVVINGLQTKTTIFSLTLTLGTDNLAKLTDEEKKIATDKGWTLA